MRGQYKPAEKPGESYYLFQRNGKKDKPYKTGPFSTKEEARAHAASSRTEFPIGSYTIEQELY
jgi:hypothetical protein